MTAFWCKEQLLIESRDKDLKGETECGQEDMEAIFAATNDYEWFEFAFADFPFIFSGEQEFEGDQAPWNFDVTLNDSLQWAELCGFRKPSLIKFFLSVFKKKHKKVTLLDAAFV